MGDFVIIRSDNFVTIANTFLKDKNLSNKAKGVLAMILALPPTWDFSIKGMVAITKDGESSLRAAINEMKENGYCAMKPVRINNKIARWKYLFSGEKLSEKLLCDFLQVEKLNVENQAQYNNIPNSSSINTPTDLNKEKRLSNDNPKKEYSEDFISFWKLYHNGGKQQAYKEWNKLTQKEKQKAIDYVNDYLKYCKYKGRTIKDTSSYLHQKGFDEDWLATPECYVVKDGDDANLVKFKTYMVQNHQALIFHRNPLTFEQIHECFDRYTYKQTEWALNKLKERDIHQYFSIAKGVEAVIDDNSEFENEEE